ncbi:allophanate hydrolase subunit 1 [Microbacterium sp. P06]|uniref:5-oxoprolinase subunit B family protein n=1 Tax=Microbacterium sp. P06 TaxID=3366949 RepID=UPI003744DC33
MSAVPVVVRPMGERALLAEVDSLEEVLALHAALDAHRPAGVVDLVPAARTVLVIVDPAALSLSAARRWIARVAGDVRTDAAAPGPLVEIAVRYDGADLAETAGLMGLTPPQLVARHLATEWSVAFTGFAPGFAYLVGDGWSFDVPRLPAPRTRVPGGSVALAGAFCGAYPRETPGGWRLIGTTDAVLFDPGVDAPTLLPPRTRVRFVEVRS